MDNQEQEAHQELTERKENQESMVMVDLGKNMQITHYI